jgi:outer membrane autotransporter protein
VEIDGSGATPGVHNDLVRVNGAATLSGGTVNVRAAPGRYGVGTQYTFLTATGGVHGTFDRIIDDVPFRYALLGYGSDSAYFTILFEKTNYGAVAQTSNELAVATYLDEVSVMATGDLVNVFLALETLSADEARLALHQIGGDVYGSMGQLGLQNTTLVLAQLRQRIGADRLSGTVGSRSVAAEHLMEPQTFRAASYSPPHQNRSIVELVPEPRDWTGWSFGLGSAGSSDSDANANGLNYGLGGTLLGVEKWFDDEQRVGFYGGYLGTQFRTAGRQQSGSIQSGQFGSYFCFDDGFDYSLVIGGLQVDSHEVRRGLLFGGIDREARGGFGGGQGFVSLERGVSLTISRCVLQPYAGVQYIHLRQNGFSETGAEALNLTVDSLDADSLRGMLGGRLQFPGLSGSVGQRLFELRAMWLHEFLATTSVVDAFFAPTNGGSYAVQGLGLGRDWAILGCGLQRDLPGGWSLYTNYDAQVNHRQVFHVGSMGLQFTW